MYERTTSNQILENTCGSCDPRKTSIGEQGALVRSPSYSEDLSFEDFEILSLVGQGAFGKVFQVRKKFDGAIYAMKIVNKQRILSNCCIPEHILLEKKAMEKINSPFTIKLHHTFQTDEYLCFVMDFINGGDLFYHIQTNAGPMARKLVVHYAAQVLLAVKQIHQSGFIYRDLKPENLLVDREGNIVLVDFGICTTTQQPCSSLSCATLEYTAPERLTGSHYDVGVDYWSFGVLLYEMITGVHPFYVEDDFEEMANRILNVDVDYSRIEDDVALSLIKQLLQYHPAARLTDVEKIQAHPFFDCVDWAAMAKKEVPAPWVPPVKGLDDTSAIDPSFISQSSKSCLYECDAEVPLELSCRMFLLSLAFQN